MRFKKCLLFTTSLVIFVSWGGLVSSQFFNKEWVLSRLLSGILVKYHYSATPLDNAFSQSAFTALMDEADPSHRLFTQEDLNFLKKNQDDIDNQFQEGRTTFFDDLYMRVDMRAAQIQKYAKERLKAPFPLHDTKTVEINAKKRTPPNNIEELFAVWDQLLHHQVLTTYLNLAKISTSDPDEKIPSSSELEFKAREKVNKEFTQWIEHIIKEKRKDRLERYFDCLIRQFDPHSNYLPPEERENFDISMSGTLEGIGAVLKEEDGYIQVSSLIIGGPAWRQKDIKANDIILKVAQGGQEYIDIVGMKVNEAVKYIRGKKGTLVRLMIKKPSGLLTEVTLTRDIVVIEETYAKSAIITIKNSSHRFGYINLPVFYHNFNEKTGRTSAEDVRIELKKLENTAPIEGIILDLRNNSGGALDDAIRLAGLFIPSGPIVQIKNRYNEIQVLEDPDPTVEYAGNLIVLINEWSASASEIVAAALQDHQRALIVGSAHSFGKGTVQTLANLDDKEFSKIQGLSKPLGSIKLTIQKFYRINGGSTQYKGVVSDIILPDTSESVTTGERILPKALQWDTIRPAKFTPISPNWNLALLKQNNALRISQSPEFQQIRKSANAYKNEQENTKLPLDITSLWNRQKKLNALQIKDTSATKPLITVKLNTKTLTDKQKEWRERLSKDIYIQETLKILEAMPTTSR